ncbi:MAG: polynucleotide adenylyltransferase PcnB [Halofilum sp. (in: g-proteobacteria)]|nr:polynucleotide adenylyltransferase PcnB [Halofilum sp. (in: g-proteobacteria)]
MRAHSDPEPATIGHEPMVVAREEHNVSRRDIDPNALKVLYRLNKAGFHAYLVGGGVRDLLLGLKPKDFDVATDALPDEVRSTFRNCRLIGRRFRLAHIVFGREVVEVATFRAGHDSESVTTDDAHVHDDGRILRDNVFGTIEDDAFRRDFTINALYYDVSRFAVLDYTGAMEDIRARRLRLIGDPVVRYREDPVRMLRAARFAAKLGFRIDSETEAPIAELGPLLADIPPARLFEEVLKLFQGGHAVASLDELVRLDLLQYLFPRADRALKAGDEGFERLLRAALANTDRRITEDKPVTPAFLYAVFLWPHVLAEVRPQIDAGESPVMAFQQAATEALARQQQATALPKRFAGPAREIWVLQPKLEGYRGKRARRLLSHPRLRAGWDFLCLRRDAGEDLAGLCDQWQQWMEAEDAPAPDPEKPRRRRRRRGGRRRSGSGDDGQ